MESRFGAELGDVRVHDDRSAAAAADRMHARAFTVGRDLVFGAGEYAPQASEGRQLLAHELAHAVQQGSDSGSVSSTQGLPMSRPTDAAERQADAAGRAAASARPVGSLDSTGPMLARQPKPGEGEETVEEPAKDIYKGTMVSEIIISLARNRVGFRTGLGMILGTVSTDLKAGKYEIEPDTAKQSWVINGPGVKSGLRFYVTLENANPWTLAYPNKLPLTVSAGSLAEPKTFGDMLDPTTSEMKDPLWLYEGAPLEKPIEGIDDFESVTYDLSYRRVNGGLSKFLRVEYRDHTTKDINIDTITEATPKLWAARREVLIIMDDYNALFMMAAFPAVFFILTMQPLATSPTGAAGARPRYSVSRRSVGKSGQQSGGQGAKKEAPKVEPAKVETPAKQGAAPAKPATRPPLTKAEAETLIVRSEGQPGPGSNVGHAQQHIPKAGATDAEAMALAQSRPAKANTTTFRTRRHAIQVLRDIMNDNRSAIDGLPADGATSVGGTRSLNESAPGFNSKLGQTATPVNINAVTWRIVRMPNGQLHLVHFAPSL
jgi:hypothetical protein